MRKFNKNDADEGGCNYYLLKKFNWMLYKENDDRLYDQNAERRFVKKLGEYLNYAQIYQKLKEIDPRLDIGTNIRFFLSQFYEKAIQRKYSRDEAIAELNEIICYAALSEVPEYFEFSQTMLTWQESIINSIYIIDNGSVSNGIMENRNKIIKDLKYNANGYRNFERFRNRIIYCLNSETIYMGVPYRPIVRFQRDRNKQNAERRQRGESRVYKKRPVKNKSLPS